MGASPLSLIIFVINTGCKIWHHDQTDRVNGALNPEICSLQHIQNPIGNFVESIFCFIAEACKNFMLFMTVMNGLMFG